MCLTRGRKVVFTCCPEEGERSGGGWKEGIQAMPGWFFDILIAGVLRVQRGDGFLGRSRREFGLRVGIGGGGSCGQGILRALWNILPVAFGRMAGKGVQSRRDKPGQGWSRPVKVGQGSFFVWERWFWRI